MVVGVTITHVQFLTLDLLEPSGFGDVPR